MNATDSIQQLDSLPMVLEELNNRSDYRGQYSVSTSHVSTTTISFTVERMMVPKEIIFNVSKVEEFSVTSPY